MSRRVFNWSGLTHLNMNSYMRLTRFKYEIALNYVSPIGILNMYWYYNLGGVSTDLDSCFRRNDG